MRTLVELFEAGTLQARAEHLKWRDAEGRWRGLATPEVVRTVHRLAGALAGRGIRPGDRVALLARNAPRWAMGDFAILHAAAVTVPLYPTLVPEQVRYILEDSGSRILLLEDAAQWRRLREGLAGLPLEAVVLLSDEDEPGTVTWSALLGEADESAALPRPTGEDLASIIYTSGTTGRPKGVMLTHWNLVSNALACDEAIGLSGREHVNLSLLPLCHVFQRLVDYLLLLTGATMAYCPNPLEAVEYMRQVRPTFFASVPRLYEKVRGSIEARLAQAPPLRRALARWALEIGRRRFHAWYRDGACDGSPGVVLRVQHALADKLVLSKLRAVFGGEVFVCFSGGAPLAPEIHEFFLGIGLPVLPGYGLTETSPVLCTNRSDRMKLGSVGPAIPGVELRVAEDGELLARGPNIMKGYLGLPEETAATLVDGWLHTGDLARMDERGNVFITGRKKEILVLTTGKKVSPALVEGHLARCPYVAQVVLVGDERKFVTALVWPNLETLAAEGRRRGWTFAAAQDLLASRQASELVLRALHEAASDISDYERPKALAFLPAELTAAGGELTPTLKYQRKMITAKYADLIDSMYRGSQA